MSAKRVTAILVAIAVLSACGAEASDESRLGEQLVRDVPKLAVLKQHDPQSFARIVGIYTAGLKAGKPQNEMVGEARDAFAREQQARLTKAPGEILLLALDSTIAVARDLEARDTRRCTALLTGHNAGDIKPLLSPSTIASEDAVFERSLTYDQPSMDVPASQSELDDFFLRSLEIQAEEKHMPPRDFMQAIDSSPDEYCAASRGMLERLRREPNAVALFRARLMAKE